MGVGQGVTMWKKKSLVPALQKEQLCLPLYTSNTLYAESTTMNVVKSNANPNPIKHTLIVMNRGKLQLQRATPLCEVLLKTTWHEQCSTLCQNQCTKDRLLLPTFT